MKSNKYNQFISSHKIYLDQCCKSIKATTYLFPFFLSVILSVLFLLPILVWFQWLLFDSIQYHSNRYTRDSPTKNNRKRIRKKMELYTKCNKSKNINLSLSLDWYGSTRPHIKFPIKQLQYKTNAQRDVFVFVPLTHSF